MKEYRIYETQKARGDQGTCAVCGKPIMSGDSMKYAETVAGLTGEMKEGEQNG